MMLNKIIEKIAKEEYHNAIEIRRYLHKYPELSENEYNTQKYIINFLEKFNIKYRKVANTGIYAIIENGNGKVIATRADMDALPINEETNLDFSSIYPNIMHACGHDIHMTVQMMVAKILATNKELWSGTVKFFFQPAEETIGGAVRMLNDGVNKDIKADAFFSFHAAPELYAGQIGIKYGKLHATSARFILKIKGKSSHAALAYKGIDAILIGSKVIDYIQTIVSRKIDARDCAVITVGTFNAGYAENIVSDFATLTGVMRTLTQETKQYIIEIFNNELKELVKSYGGTLEIEIIDSYAPVINDDNMTKILENNSRNILGDNNTIIMQESRMDAEDVGYFINEIPGTFFRLGTSYINDDNKVDLHNSKLLIDEESLKTGIIIQLKNILEFLHN